MKVENYNYDLVIIGAGLVGLATGYQYLKAYPGSSLLILEKENEVCQHQSGRNSGVIHSGIYYKPGSQKATNCRLGKDLLEKFCTEHDLPWKRSGKVIVATNQKEQAALALLLEKAKANTVTAQLISAQELHELEPAVNGLSALHVPETGVVDYRLVGKKLAELIQQMGGLLVCGAKLQSVSNVPEGLHLVTTTGEFRARRLVNCAGLYSDKILQLCGEKTNHRIIPFRGEYYFLNEQSAQLCRNLIYPVPNPDFPFLGVHFTRGIYGEVDCGPNAVLAFAREGYSLRTINPREFIESLSFTGLQRLVLKHWKYAFKEIGQSISKDLFLRAAKRLIPELQAKDLLPAPSGVRAQAVSIDGKPVDDFLVQTSRNAVHVLNAPSPAATSCLSIGLNILERLSAMKR